MDPASKRTRDLDDEDSDSVDTPSDDVTGWQVAYRGIQLALNNEIEEAQKVLKGDSSCIHRQAGFCYLTFIVSPLTVKFKLPTRRV